MPLDPMDLAKAGIRAVLEHHIPGTSGDVYAQRVTALIEAISDEIAVDLVWRGALEHGDEAVELHLSVFAAEALVPAVLDRMRQLAAVGETRH